MKKKRPELAVVSAARDSRQTSAARADIDPDAFARAYGDYARRIYAYLLRFTGNHEDAEDLVQQTCPCRRAAGHGFWACLRATHRQAAVWRERAIIPSVRE